MKIIKADATIHGNGGQPYIEVNDGPANSGTFNITLHDPETGATISTLAHLADSYNHAQTKYYLTLPIPQLDGKIVVCTSVLKRVAPGPLVFQLWIKQDNIPVAGAVAENPPPAANTAPVNLENIAFRVTLHFQP